MGLPIDKPVEDALIAVRKAVIGTEGFWFMFLLKQIETNDIAIQAADSETCGHWCLWFLSMMDERAKKMTLRLGLPLLPGLNLKSKCQSMYKSILASLSKDDYTYNELFITRWWRALMSIVPHRLSQGQE